MLTKEKIKELKEKQDKDNNVWTEEEDKTLVECYNAGIFISTLIQENIINRTENSIYSRVRALKRRGLINDKKRDR